MTTAPNCFNCFIFFEGNLMVGLSRRVRCCNYLLVMLVMCFGQAASAVGSDKPTPPLVGHIPTVDNVAIDNQLPSMGDTLTVNYDYADADASTIRWLNNGRVVAGQTTKQYTLGKGIINTGAGNACDFSVVAEVTAQSRTGDPKLGTAKTSAPVSVQFPVIPDFTFPNVTPLKWDDASRFCENKGMQLPTAAQLRTVFNTYTSGSSNYQMAEKYGWPLSGGRCGGSSNLYWTSDQSMSGFYIATDMYSSAKPDAGYHASGYSYHVVCVQPLAS